MLYVESLKAKARRSDELRAMGCFTLPEAAAKTGLSIPMLRYNFRRDRLKHEVATDSTTGKTTAFYFPPGK